TVGFAQSHGRGHKEGVVQDVMVAQGCALGRSGGAAGELDVDGIVKLEFVSKFHEVCQASRACLLLHVSKSQHSRLMIATEMNDPTQSGKLCRAQPARLCVI